LQTIPAGGKINISARHLVRNSRHQSLRARTKLLLLCTVDQTAKRIRRKNDWQRKPENGERLSQVGIWGSHVAADSRTPENQITTQKTEKQTW